MTLGLLAVADVVGREAAEIAHVAGRVGGENLLEFSGEVLMVES